jgi:hypothetical protein
MNLVARCMAKSTIDIRSVLYAAGQGSLYLKAVSAGVTI